MNEKKGQLPALILSTLAMAVSFTVWGVLSPMAQEVQQEFGLSATQTSFLVASPVILGSIMRIPMGVLSDKFSGRKVYTLTMLFLIIPLIGASFAKTYTSLMFFVFLIGMAGATFSIAITYISGWYSQKKQGFALGIAGMGNIGTAIAGFSVPMIVATYSISAAFRVLAVAIAIMAIIFYLGTKDQEQTGEKSLKDSLEALKYKQTWLLSVFYFLTFGVFVAMGIYLPTLLINLFSLSAVDAGQRAAGFIILATLVRPIGGLIADKFNPKLLVTIVFAGITLSAGILAFFTGSIVPFTVFSLLIAFFSGVGNGVIFKLVPFVSPSNTGAVTGIVGAAGGLGGYFPPILLGIVKDNTGDYLLGFILLAAFSLICLIINLGRKRVVN